MKLVREFGREALAIMMPIVLERTCIHARYSGVFPWQLLFAVLFKKKLLLQKGAVSQVYIQEKLKGPILNVW